MTIVVEGINEPFIFASSLDEGGKAPLSDAISAHTRVKVQNDDYTLEQMLKDEASLTKRLKTSRTSVHRALWSLQYGAPARTHVTDARDALPPIHRQVSLTSLLGDLKEAGFEPETEILEYKIEAAGPEIASFLDCDDDCEVAHIKRLRYGRGRPLAILNNILVASKAPAPSTLTESGLYEQLRNDGSRPASAYQQVGARCATPEEAGLLLIDEGNPVITVERTVYAENDEVVDIEEDVYDASQYLLTFSLPVG